MNGNKCGVIHCRRKGEERSKASFNVGQESIRMVQEYKYLGCVEYLNGFLYGLYLHTCISRAYCNLV